MIQAPTEEIFVVGRPRHTGDGPLMTREGSGWGSLFQVPDLQHAVAPTNKALAVRPHRHTAERIGVSRQGAEFRSCLDIPDLQRAIQTATDDPFAIRAHRHAEHLAPVTTKEAFRLLADPAETVGVMGKNPGRRWP